MYLTQLGDLLNAGLTMHDAMGELAQHGLDGRLRRMSREISAGAATGVATSTQFARYPQIMPAHVRAMLLAGERAGTLPAICQELADELRQQQGMKWKASIGQGLFTLLLLVALIVPGTPRVLSEHGPPPDYAPNFGAFGDYLLHVALPIAIGWTVLWYVTKFLSALPIFSGAAQTLLYHLPFSGPLIRHAAILRFNVALDSLLGAGVPIQEAMGLAAETTGNVVMVRSFRAAAERVRAGQNLAQALTNVKGMPAEVRSALTLAERAGSYQHTLGTLADSQRQSRGRLHWASLLSGYIILFLISCGITAIVWAYVARTTWETLFRLLEPFEGQ